MAMGGMGIGMRMGAGMLLLLIFGESKEKGKD